MKKIKYHIESVGKFLCGYDPLNGFNHTVFTNIKNDKFKSDDGFSICKKCEHKLVNQAIQESI